MNRVKNVIEAIKESNKYMSDETFKIFYDENSNDYYYWLSPSYNNDITCFA